MFAIFAMATATATPSNPAATGMSGIIVDSGGGGDDNGSIVGT